MKRLKALQSIFMRSSGHNSPKGSSDLPESEFTPCVVAIAPDKFKGTLTADEVAGEVGRAVAEAFPDAIVHLYPMADGGEGTAAVIAEKMNLQPANCAGHNSLMQPITIEYYQDETVCAVDSAAIIGLPMLGDTPPDPWHSTSYGLGEFIAARMAEGKSRLYVGIGGTASIDGGAGMLQALGAVFRDVGGSAIGTHDNPVCAGDLWKIFSTDLTAAALHAVRDSVTGIADVNLPLIPSTIEEVSDMSHMSSLSFACQKGLPQQDLPQLYESLANYAAAIDTALLPTSRRTAFNGAGGGVGYALHRVLRCPCVAGAEFISGLYGIFDTTPPPDCLITGEGSFDAQSLQGKATGTLLSQCAARNIPAFVIAGRTSATTPAAAGITETSPFMSPGTPLNHESALTALRNSLPSLLQSIRHSRERED